MSLVYMYESLQMPPEMSQPCAIPGFTGILVHHTTDHFLYFTRIYVNGKMYKEEGGHNFSTGAAYPFMPNWFLEGACRAFKGTPLEREVWALLLSSDKKG